MTFPKTGFRPAILGILAVLFIIWSCRVSDSGGNLLNVKADSTWTRYDKVMVILADTAGNPLDTLFNGHLTSPDQLKGLDGSHFDGGKVQIILVGFLGGEVAKRETRPYDGQTATSGEKIVVVIIPLDPVTDTSTLDIKPDNAKLYTGGPTVTLAPAGTGWDKKQVTWSSLSPAVATVVAGTVTPVGPGKAWIKAVSGTQKDSSEITVVTDPPVLDAGADTVILTNASVIFRIKAKQEFGVFAMFKWSLDGDTAWDDSTSDISPTASVLSAPSKTFTKADTVTIRFYVRDGEGNAATTTRKITVSKQAPKITSLLKDMEIQIGDSAAFSAQVEVTPGLIKKFTWDYGDGSAPVVGSISTAKGEVDGGHRYTTANAYKVSLTVEDDLGNTIASSVNVKVDPVKNPRLPSINSIKPGDTTITIKDSLTFIAKVGSKTALKSYGWDVDNDGKADATDTVSDTAATIKLGKRFPNPGSFPITLKVLDANNGADSKTVTVTVLADAPIAKAGADTSVAAGTTVNLHGKASDGLGKVVKTEWKIGSGAYTVANPDTSFLAPASGIDTLTCSFRVTDDDGQTSEDQVLITVLASTDANLASLSVSVGAITPTFNKDVLAYSVGVANTVASLTVTPTAANAGATLKVNGTAVASGAASGSIALAIGPTTVNVEVTAKSGATRTYVLTVNRESSGLADLVFTSATITSKTPTKVSYSYTITNNGTAAVPNLYNVSIQNYYSVNTVFNDGTDVAAGGAILGVTKSLAPGESYNGTFYASGAVPAGLIYLTFKIDFGDSVKESNETNNTMYKQVLVPPVADAGADTTVAAGSAINLHGKASDPVGSVAKTEWKIGAGAFTVASADTSFNAPSVGGTSFQCHFRVTDDDGLVAEDSALVTVSASADADLLALVPSAGSLVPVFSKGITGYTLAVANTVTSMTFTPTVDNTSATVKVNTVAVISGAASGSLALAVGPNPIAVEVTAQSGLKKTYNVTVTRAGSSVSTLQSLTATAGTLSPAFAAGTLGYTVNTSAATTTITPTVTAGSNATVTVNGVTVASGSASAAISLAVGNTTNVDIVVTPESGGVVRTYTIGFTVPGSTLPDLIVTSATITAVSSSRVDYSYTIKNNGGTAIPDLYNVAIQNFYSVDNVFNNAGDVAGGGSILGIHKSLAPGESYSGTYYASNAGPPAGTKYVTWQIDWGNSIAESDETNNTVAMPLP